MLGWLELAILLFALSLSVTTAASALGLAGGALISPILILVLGLEPRIAIGTTIVGVFTAILSASLAYLRQGRVDVWLALLFDALDVAGVALGAYLTVILPPELLVSSLGAFLLYSGSRLALRTLKGRDRPVRPAGSSGALWRRAIRDSEGKAFSYGLGVGGLVVAICGSFFSGLISGMLGLGGGFMDLSLMLLLGIPVEVAIPTVMFGMLITRASSVVAHALLGNIRLDTAIPLALGALLGGQLGPRIFKRARPEMLKLAFSCVILVLGAMLLLKCLGALLEWGLGL